MPTGRLFLIGGGNFEDTKIPESMFECCEIFTGSKYQVVRKDRMGYPRHGHSACSLGNKFIIVTGSRKNQAMTKAEYYNCNIDCWFDIHDIK